MQAYDACRGLVSGTSNGLLNPTLAAQQLFWEMGSFDSLAFKNDPENTMTIFTNRSYGRHFWIYLLAPLLAGIVAGVFARKHYDLLIEEEEKRINSEVRVFAEN